MKILYHHRTQGRGAEGVHIREIVNALRNLGHEVYVVSPPGVDPFNKNLNKSKKPKINRIWKHVSKHFPEIFFELFEIGYNFVGYTNLKKIIKRKKIDLIYERYAFFCWAGTYLAKRYSIPVILEVNEISGIKRQRGRILVSLAKKIERKIFEGADVIVTVSSFLKKHIENIGINSDKIYVIPNAVDVKEFNPDISDIEIRNKFGINKKIVLGFVGWFSWWDNLEFLIDVFSEVVKEIPNVHLMLIGDGINRKELEHKTIKKGISNNVTFTGRVNRQEVPNFIAAMDICVIPHSNPFGSPVVLFEYMAMAKPVAAPRLEPIKDVITNDVNGVLFEPKDEGSLKKCLLNLINDEQKRKRLGEEARKTVLHQHLWKHNADKIMQIYSGIKRKC